MLGRVTFLQGLLVAFLFLIFFSARVQILLAQSSDQGLPTPVLSNETTGTIRALDIGDPRLTRHFYAFDATPGDLIISLDSRNLNGDVDIFTAVTFRPLMKISMYADVATSKVTKTIYLRSRQILILRVEARSPNDESGLYHISFGGSFQPFSGGIPVAENTETGTESENARQSNVSSVGARIERPSEPANKTKPAERPTEETAKAPLPASKPRTTRARTPSRGTRSARNRPARPTAQPPKTATAKTEPPPAETKASQPEEKPEEKPGAKPEEKPAAASKPEPEKPAAQPSGPHLIIERTDGNRLDRPMSTVRRVVIESGVIVITLKNGRVERIPLAGIVKMSIEP